MLTAILVAAGSSRRMGFDKLFAPVLGKPAVAYTIAAFEDTRSVTEIIIVTRADRLEEFQKLVSEHVWTKVAAIVPGGEQRQDSVRAGLQKLGDKAEYVAIHDAARPLVTPELIERVFQQCQIDGAATAAEAVADTLKRADADLFVSESVDRDHLYAMQTPQIFERDMIENACRTIADDKISVTDEVSAAEHLGFQVALVPSEDLNFKITYERDLKLAELILQQRAAASASM